MCAEFTPGQPLEIEKLMQAAVNIRRIIREDWGGRVFPGGTAPILIRIETRAGHGAGIPTEKQIDELADQWAFLTRALNMPEAR